MFVLALALTSTHPVYTRGKKKTHTQTDTDLEKKNWTEAKEEEKQVQTGSHVAARVLFSRFKKKEEKQNKEKTFIDELILKRTK